MKFIHKLLLFIISLIISAHTYAQSVGLVMSGGGAKGIAHIGVIKALEENEIPTPSQIRYNKSTFWENRTIKNILFDILCIFISQLKK